MFLKNSRYVNVATVETTLSTGERVNALKLRRLAVAPGDARTVHSGDRLDIIAEQEYAQATWFWHIADANTALDSRTLVEQTGDTLVVPRD
jgi:hypothetical protein